MTKRRRSEYAGKDGTTGIPLNPFRMGHSNIAAWERITLLNLTGTDNTMAPFNRRAWLGGPQIGPVPIPSRIPPE
jgi:hypothetical protein